MNSGWNYVYEISYIFMKERYQRGKEHVNRSQGATYEKKVRTFNGICMLK